MSRDASHTAYSRMVKATSVVAGAKIATILVSVIRMKAIASLLGPSGMGLVNLVSSSVDLTRVLTNLGVDSGVIRTISAAHAQENHEKVRVTYHVAVRTGLVIGLLGWCAISVASPWISRAATGTDENAWLYVLGGASLLFTHLLGVQLALLQGLRQIKSLALCHLLAAPIAAVVTVGLIYLYGEKGGVGALVASSLVSLIIHLRFVRRHRPKVSLPATIPYRLIIANNLRDGSGFAINAIWLTASGWISLILIRAHYGDQGAFHVGMYSAASMLANFYVGIVISALGTEFFPSLSAVSGSPEKMRQLLNSQAALALDAGLVASLVLMVAAPVVLLVLYSAKFTPAADLLRLLLCGTAIRFASFPLGFVILALGRSKLFANCELAMGITTITFACIGASLYGLHGLAAAIITANFLQATGLYLLTSKLDVSWDRSTRRKVIGAFITLTAVLALSLTLQTLHGYLATSAIVIAYGCLALRRIQRSSGITLSLILKKIRPIPTN